MDTPLPASAPLNIDIVSDVVCPWCYLGKRRLERAVSLAGVDATVRWRPFRLDPTIPPGGIDRREYLTRKFGSVEAVAPAHAQLSALGKEEGIDYRFDLITRSPDTVDAHRVIRWASADRQDAMTEGLFRAYFTEGREIDDHAVLAALASEVGLDATAVAARLATDEDRAEVKAEIDHAYRIGVTGVPCFILDGRYAVMGAQPPEMLADAITQVAARKSEAPVA